MELGQPKTWFLGPEDQTGTVTGPWLGYSKALRVSGIRCTNCVAECFDTRKAFQYKYMLESNLQMKVSQKRGGLI